jgi:hypothetical protein
MAVSLKEKSFSTLVLVVIVGILIGSYLNALIGLIPGGNNVVQTFFTHNFINFGLGDLAGGKPFIIDLYAIKFQVGFEMKFSLLSILGVALSLYFFRWYK